MLMAQNKGVGLSSKNFQEQTKECEKLVIGFFAGRRSSFHVFEEEIKKVWKPKSQVAISIHGTKAFVFNFSLEEDRKSDHEHGSSHLAGKLFIVRPWTLLIEQSIAEMKKILVWVLIYNVPLHLWNKLGLRSIASFIGITLMMDECTKKKTRLSYARVCAEISYDCPYPSLIPLWIDGRHVMDLPVEYQWKPPKCSNCLSFGHTASSCSLSGVKKKVHWNPEKNQIQGNSLVSANNQKEIGNQESTGVSGAEISVHNTHPSKEVFQLDIPLQTNENGLGNAGVSQIS